MAKIDVGGELYSVELKGKLVDAILVKDISRDDMSLKDINDDIETNATYSKDSDYILTNLNKVINSYTKNESDEKFASKQLIKYLSDCIIFLENRIRVLESKHDIIVNEIKTFNKSFNKSFR